MKKVDESTKRTGALAPAKRTALKSQLPPLWKHQEETLEFLRNNERVLDASDPGTGKTRGHLEAFAERRRNGGGRALVVAPKSLLRSAWFNDAWKYTPDMECSIAYAKNREDAFLVDADIYIINTDGVKWIADRVKRNKKWLESRGFDTLIIDELTTFKHHTSQRSKAIKKLAPSFKYRSGLTGTPNSNSITDIWHQVLLLDDGQRLGRSFFKFRNAVCEPVQIGPMANHLRWEDKEGSEATVSIMLSDMSIRHQFEDCMDIPPNHTYSVTYEPSQELLRKYKELENNLILELENGEVTALNAAVLQNKLLQVASGAVYSADHEYHVIDRGRYELIAQLASGVDHSVVFFNWAHQKEELCKEFEKNKISYAVIDGDVKISDREKIVRDYQRGEFQTLLLHPQTGAHGLTLTKGTRTIWSSPIYQADFLKQGLHRIYRGGQTLPTETILVEALGTIEHQVYERLQTKHGRMVSLLEMIKGNHHG